MLSVQLFGFFFTFVFVVCRINCEFIPRRRNRGFCLRGWSFGAGWSRWDEEKKKRLKKSLTSGVVNHWFIAVPVPNNASNKINDFWQPQNWRHQAPHWLLLCPPPFPSCFSTSLSLLLASFSFFLSVAAQASAASMSLISWETSSRLC